MVFFLESLKNKRSRNEDSYCHMDLKMNHEATISAYAVADGMGGLSAGNRYSKNAVSLWYEELLHLMMSEEFKDCSLKSQIDSLKDFSLLAFDKINRKLYQMGMDAGTKGGTTLTTAIHFWDTWIIANCGDSPVYVSKDGELTLVSQIQNLAWQLVRQGKTGVGSSLFLQNKNRLLEYLGRREEVHPYGVVLRDKEVDMILMGSDGAFGDLTVEEMNQFFLKAGNDSSILQEILRLARDHGETDNQTAFLIRSKKQECVTADPDNIEAQAMDEQYEAEEDEEVFIGVEGRDYVSAGGIFSRLFPRRRS